MVRKVEYFEVSDNFSEDGRSPLGWKTLGTFSSEAVAKEFAKGRGNWNHDASVERKVVYIADSIEDQEQADKDKVVRSGMDKLTEGEKEALEQHWRKT